MAPLRSFSVLMSFVLTYTFLPIVLAAPWIVTEDYQQVRVTEYVGDYYSGSAVVTTSIEEITPTMTPLPAAISTITAVDSMYSDVTVIEKLYATGVGTPAYYNEFYGTSSDDDTHMTVYVVNLTFTAPTGCSSQWTTTTAATVYPPVEVRSDLPTTAMSTLVSVDTSQPFQPTTVTYDYVWVKPTQVPADTLSDLSAEHYPSTLYSNGGCSNYVTSSNCRYCSGYYDDDEGNWFFDSYWTGISPFALTMIITFGWIGIWLIAGFIEAWVRFRRLMTGWQTRRGLPVCWAFLVLPITLFLLCCFRKGYFARSAEDAEVLKQKWNDMSFWTKLRLFFVWGFRYKYPPMLGEAPPRVKMSKRPGKQNIKHPGEPLLSAGEPRAAETERGVSENPEMAEVESSTRRSSGQEQNTQHAIPEASGALTHHEDDEVGRAR